jgi:hypothetical protein
LGRDHPVDPGGHGHIRLAVRGELGATAHPICRAGHRRVGENGAIDWAMVKARDVDFAYARATSGTNSRDPSFTANWTGAGDAQIRRGAIHVFSLCGTADEQAGAFVATVPRDPGRCPPRSTSASTRIALLARRATWC